MVNKIENKTNLFILLVVFCFYITTLNVNTLLVCIVCSSLQEAYSMSLFPISRIRPVFTKLFRNRIKIRLKLNKSFTMNFF